MNPSSPSPTSPPQGPLSVMVIMMIGCLGAFIAGFFIRDAIRPTTPQGRGTTILTTPKTTITPTKPPDDTTQGNTEALRFKAGNHYFDDTVMAITMDTPRQAIVATMTRTEENSTYLHNTRVSYFDGTTWTRKKTSQVSSNPNLSQNEFIKQWNIGIDKTRVLKEQINGEISTDGNTIEFFSANLQNEMSIRSLPGYTKYMSESPGQLTINGTMHPAKILYTRIYSMDTDAIQFYDQPIGLTTDWLAFWDTAGNFYHVDATSVTVPTPIYQTHSLGIYKNALGSITKTFSVLSNRDDATPPKVYTFTMSSPIGATIKLVRKNEINKAPNNSYDWYMGTVEGTVSAPNTPDQQGFGIIEYIHD